MGNSSPASNTKVMTFCHRRGHSHAHRATEAFAAISFHSDTNVMLPVISTRNAFPTKEARLQDCFGPGAV